MNKEKKAKDSNKKNVRSRSVSPKLIVALGTIIGGALICLGVFNNLNSTYDKMDIKSEEEMEQIVKEKLEKYESLREERQKEYNISALSDRYEQLSREISTAEGELLDAEAELYNVQSGKYESTKRDKFFGSVPFIILGVVVIIFGLGLAMKVDTAEKKRKNVILTITEDK